MSSSGATNSFCFLGKHAAVDDDKVHAMVRNGAMLCGGRPDLCQCSSVLSFNASLHSAECQIELHFRGTRDPVLERP